MIRAAVTLVIPPRPLTTSAMTLSSAIVIAVVLVAIGTIGILQWRSRLVVFEGGFWFDDVTFDLLPDDVARLGGPITEREKAGIESLAESELRAAYDGLRITFSANHDAFNRVLVVQEVSNSRDAGQSRVLRPLGGRGSVNFLTLADLAIHHAPPGADRGAIIDGIGRGIGRAAAHEFAHQFLPGINIHASRDDHSYEFASSDRDAEYYGPMHWDIARPALLSAFGR